MRGHLLNQQSRLTWLAPSAGSRIHCSGESWLRKPAPHLEPDVLDDDAQMQIVPPPKPHKEALMRKAAKSLPHLLIHKPHNPYCEICNQAKLRESPHRAGTGTVPILEYNAEFLSEAV